MYQVYSTTSDWFYKKQNIKASQKIVAAIFVERYAG